MPSAAAIGTSANVACETILVHPARDDERRELVVVDAYGERRQGPPDHGTLGACEQQRVDEWLDHRVDVAKAGADGPIDYLLGRVVPLAQGSQAEDDLEVVRTGAREIPGFAERDGGLSQGLHDRGDPRVVEQCDTRDRPFLAHERRGQLACRCGLASTVAGRIAGGRGGHVRTSGARAFARPAGEHHDQLPQREHGGADECESDEEIDQGR